MQVDEAERRQRSESVDAVSVRRREEAAAARAAEAEVALRRGQEEQRRRADAAEVPRRRRAAQRGGAWGLCAGGRAARVACVPASQWRVSGASVARR